MVTEIKKQQTNRFKVVGTLVQNDLKNQVAKTGKNAGKSFISGNIVVKSVIDGVEQMFQIRLYALEVTQKNERNKLYDSYSELGDLLNRRVSVSGSLSENRFWSTKTKQIMSGQILFGRFVNEAKAVDKDVANYEFSGYVARELVDKTTKDGNLYAYELVLGQVDYTGKSAQIFKFQVQKDREDIAKFIRENYLVGSTVSIEGPILFLTETKTREKKMAFGEPQASSFTITNHYFYITAGAPVIDDETSYKMDELLAYKKAIAAHDIEIQNRASENDASADEETPLASRATSLL